MLRSLKEHFSTAFVRLFLVHPFRTLVVWTIVVVLAMTVVGFGPKPFGDGEYFEGALDVVRVFQGSSSIAEVRVDKGLVTVLYYAFPFTLLGADCASKCLYTAAVIWNLVWVVAGTWLLYRATSLFAGLRAGGYFLLLTMAFPVHLYYAFGIVAETVSYLGVSLLFLGWVKWLVSTHRAPLSSGWWWLCASGLVLLVGARLNLVPVFFVLLILSISTAVSKVESIRVASSLFLLALIGFSSIVGLNLVSRNLDRSGAEYRRWLFYRGLVIGHFEFRHEPFNWLHWMEELRSDSKDFQLYKSTLERLLDESHHEPSRYAGVFGGWAVRTAAREPLITLRQALIKSIHSQAFIANGLILRFRDRIQKEPSALGMLIVFHLVINAVNLIVVGGWLVFLVKNRRNWPGIWPLWALWVANLPLVLILHSEPRYMFPPRALMVVAAAMLFAQNSQRFIPDEKRGVDSRFAAKFPALQQSVPRIISPLNHIYSADSVGSCERSGDVATTGRSGPAFEKSKYGP